MTTYDPTELLGIIEAIVEDGELTADEIYGLAEWLNDHKEAWYHWPGNLLVEPLQAIWADGKLTKTELRQMARLLGSIRKEASKRQSQEALGNARAYAEDCARNFNPDAPQLLLIPFSFKIRSESDPGEYYDVDFNYPTCTCPDFRSLRRKLPLGHLTRCCKHIMKTYAQMEPDSGWPVWLEPFLGNGFPPHPEQEWKLLPADSFPTLISSAPHEWANVFVWDQGAYDRYGYNIHEDRWSYSIAPPNSRMIAKEIAKLTRL